MYNPNGKVISLVTKQLFANEKRATVEARMMESNKFTEYCINRQDITYAVEFCHIDSASQLLAVGTDAKVSIYLCKFKVIGSSGIHNCVLYFFYFFFDLEI